MKNIFLLCMLASLLAGCESYNCYKADGNGTKAEIQMKKFDVRLTTNQISRICEIVAESK